LLECGTLYFPLTTSDILNYKYPITPSALLNNNMPEGTILSIQALAIDRVIGRYFNYETLIPNNGQLFNVPSESDYFVWVGSEDKVVKANFNSTATVTVATPSIQK